MALVGLGVLAQDFLLGAEAESALIDAALASGGSGLGNVFQAATLTAQTDASLPVLPLRGGDVPRLKMPPPRQPPPPVEKIVNEGLVVLAVGVVLAFCA